MPFQLNILKFLFYIFPIFIFSASGYLNAYIFIFILYCFFFIYFKKLKFSLIILDYIIILFFFSCVISSLLNSNQIENFNIGGKQFNFKISVFIKSIFNFRFVLLYIIVRNIINNQLISIKILSIISLICCIFLSLNIILQHLIGFDLFGNPPFEGRYNGLFEHEAIAGGYIQKFFLISLFSFFCLKIRNFTQFLLIIIFINILGLGILLSLDRMPYIIFIFSIIILLVLLKKYRLELLISLILVTLIFQIFFNNYQIVKNRYHGLAAELELSKIIKLFSNSFSKLNISKNKSDDDYNLKASYLGIYDSAYQVFLERPFLGSGVKSFSYRCNILKINSNKNLTCSTHPHNIYLEILINQGIIGFILFLLFIIILIKKNYVEIILSKITENDQLQVIFFFSILIAELVPIRSYGSIFQTVNGSIFWFFLAILSSRIHIPKKIY